MKKIIVVSLIIGIILNSCKKPQDSHITINLGDSEWKFTKVKPLNMIDLAKDKKMDISVKKFPLSIKIDLQKPQTLELARILFADTLIAWASYKVEGSLTGVEKDWALLSDRSWDNEAPRAYKISNLGETKNRPVESEKIEGICVENYLNGKFRFLRITITKLEDKNKKNLLPGFKQIEVWGTEESLITDTNYKNIEYQDSTWESIGIPHCFNDMDTYLNASHTSMWRGIVWYRRHLKIDKLQQGKKVFLEFQGVNIGAAVYVNGKFKAGKTDVKQPGEVTHVGGFLPFVVDITDDVKFGEENVVAVRVSNANYSFFTWPGFGVYEGFGMAWGGIVCPVYLHFTDKVYIPVDAASTDGRWGTYFSTVSADSIKAKVRILTNIANDNEQDKEVTLVTTILNTENQEVISKKETKKIAANKSELFDQVAEIENPHLWFPNNSPFGKPYLYKVIHKVEIEGQIVDSYTNTLGIRVITWDSDYCYVNGKKHLLLGFGHRNVYPALGSAVPADLQWKDIKLIADCGGNALRVGHVPATKVMVEACDAFGIMVIQNSGDNEWSLKNEPATTYKKEYDRNMLISFRNHPSIAVWESNNGIARDKNVYSPKKTYDLVEEMDFIQPRIVESRDTSDFWPVNKKIMIGYTNRYQKVEGSPSINMEVYGAVWNGGKSWNMDRFDYENEKTFSNWFVNNYLSDINNRACGWIDWMLAETQGEAYTIYLNGKSKQKSLGSSAMDGNRFPKLKYNIYKNALWVPFSKKSGVILQSNWNLSGIQTVDTWSNCPYVELFLNDKSLGKRIPDANTRRCTWEKVNWEAGTLKVTGLNDKGIEVCNDVRVTSGKPHHLVIIIEPTLTKPDGSRFTIKANGSDAAIITVKIMDKDGNWCPLAANNLKFNVSGEGVFRGSYNFYVDRTKPLFYHTPGDVELQAEGGLMRVAIRSTFKPGKISVTASSDGLISASVNYETIK